MSSKSPTLKEHLVMHRLYKDGFIKGDTDEIVVMADPLKIHNTYGDDAEIYWVVMHRVIDGLKKNGYRSSKKVKNLIKRVADGPYAGQDVVNLMDLFKDKHPVIYTLKKGKGDGDQDNS